MTGDGTDCQNEAVYRFSLQVRWGDMDSFQHVNNAQYLRYLEEARVRWLESLPGVSLRDRVAPVLAASQLNYRAPILWPAEILIELFVEKVGTSSLTLSHRILSAADPSLLHSDGSVVMVWVDTQSGKSVPLPHALRAALA